ncbi:MAG: hypothetical protein AAB529_00730 [Patescibacteria group bacterium]
MNALEWLLAGILVVMVVFLTGLATMGAVGWRRAISFTVGTIALLATATVMAVKLSSPVADSAESVGKDFYRVEWEEKTPKGTTMVVVRDESGELYFSEFDTPLGVPKVLVVEKERFRPLLLPEKPK